MGKINPDKPRSGGANPSHCKGSVGVRSCGKKQYKTIKSAVDAKLFLRRSKILYI